MEVPIENIPITQPLEVAPALQPELVTQFAPENPVADLAREMFSQRNDEYTPTHELVYGKYENGYDLVIRSIHKRVKDDRDVLCATTATEGAGKSAFTLRMAMDYAKRAHVPFDVEANVIYNPDVQDLANRINRLPKFSPILVDEAVKVMLKDEHYLKAAVFLKKLFATCRKQNKVVFTCMPYFTDYQLYFRKNRILIWFYIIDRGVAAVFIKDNVDPASEDPWHLKEFKELIEEHSRVRYRISDYNAREKLNLYSHHRNFFCAAKASFPPLEIWNAYRKLSEQVSLEVAEEWDANETLWKRRMAALVLNLSANKIASIDTCAKLTSMDAGQLSGFVKRTIGNTPKGLLYYDAMQGGKKVGVPNLRIIKDDEEMKRLINHEELIIAARVQVPELNKDFLHHELQEDLTANTDVTISDDVKAPKPQPRVLTKEEEEEERQLDELEKKLRKDIVERRIELKPLDGEYKPWELFSTEGIMIEEKEGEDEPDSSEENAEEKS